MDLSYGGFGAAVEGLMSRIRGPHLFAAPSGMKFKREATIVKAVMIAAAGAIMAMSGRPSRKRRMSNQMSKM
jgi:hypothetical protein